MLKGIEQAAAFLLFLSVDVLNRPYCQMEIRHALALKKPVVLLHGAPNMNHSIFYDGLSACLLLVYRERRPVWRL